MVDLEWVAAPIGIDAERWVSRSGCRTVLIVVHTMVSSRRLLDIVDLIEQDTRLQIVFTVAPDVFNIGVAAHLQGLGALVLPWRQAVRETFDLAVAAAHGGLHEVHAPVLLVAHGAGRSRLTGTTVYGLDGPRLMRDGRVIAAAIALSHEAERDVLTRQCPEALPAALVVGDPCFDRLVADLPVRSQRRRALGLSERQRLVVVSSTWGAEGLFGAVPDLVPMLMDQLPPDRFRVALLLHPAIEAAHGRRQIDAWTRDCREAGLTLADPAEDWRTYLVAADCLVGDRGSVTAYGAGIGLPVLCAPTGGAERVAPGSPQSAVLSAARHLDLASPLRPQIQAARPVDRRRIAAAITSRPGRAARLLRQTIYGLLGLPARVRS
jgi:hypothetical protein